MEEVDNEDDNLNDHCENDDEVDKDRTMRRWRGLRLRNLSKMKATRRQRSVRISQTASTCGQVVGIDVVEFPLIRQRSVSITGAILFCGESVRQQQSFQLL